MKSIVVALVLSVLAGAAAAQGGSGWAAPAAPAETSRAAPAQGEAAGGAGVAAGSWGTGSAPEAAPGFEPEKQVATGQFLTALEVKPILAATKGNWVAVREYGGQDLLYFTHLLAWRCGLHQIRYAVNDGPEEVFEAEPCHVDTNAPNAITSDMVYRRYPLGSVESVQVHLIYDDATEETADFERKAILMP